MHRVAFSRFSLDLHRGQHRLISFYPQHWPSAMSWSALTLLEIRCDLLKQSRLTFCKVSRKSMTESGGLPETFPEIPIKNQCFRRQSRNAAKHSSVTRNCQGWTGNVGRSRAARSFRVMKVSRIRQGIRFILWLSHLSQELTHCLRIPLLSFVRLPGKSLFLVSTSPHKLSLSLWALSPHIFAWWSCNLWVSSSR